MCSVDEDEDLLLPRAKPTACESKNSKCVKCPSPAVALARVKDPFCKECFHTYFTHRFRSTFGKAKVVRQNEKALLAFSGGQSSRVLLHLIEEGLRESVHKKLRFHPSILIIDEGALVGQSWEERTTLLDERIAIATSSRFPVYFTTLEQVFGSYQFWSNSQGTRPHGNNNNASSEQLSADTKDITGDNNTVSSCTSSVADTDRSPMVAEGLASVQSPHHVTTYQQSMARCVRSVECEDKLVRLFADTASATAREDLLRSLRNQLIATIARKLQCTKVIVGENETRLSVRLFSDIAQGRGNTAPLDTSFADDRHRDVMFVRPMREFPGQEIATYCVLFGLQTVTTASLTAMAPNGKASIDKLTETFINGLQCNFPSTVNSIFRTGEKLSLQYDSSTTRCDLCWAPINRPLDEDNTLCYGCRLTIKDVHTGAELPPYAERSKRTKIEDYLL